MFPSSITSKARELRKRKLYIKGIDSAILQTHSKLVKQSMSGFSSQCNSHKVFKKNLSFSKGSSLSHTKSSTRSWYPFRSDSRNSSISSLVYQFLQDESRFLTESFKMKHSSGEERMNISTLSEPIQKELIEQMDDYNRFIVLLSHHPLTVPYQMLLQYYTALPKILPLDKQALLRTLVFHNAWDEFWTIILADKATLTDLEETVEFIHDCLLASKTTRLGVWLALSAAQKRAASTSIFSSICEIMQYKFCIPQGDMSLFHKMNNMTSYQVSNELSHTSFQSDSGNFHINTDLKAFFIVKYAQQSQEPTVVKFIIDRCEEDTLLYKIPGFVSMILSESFGMHLTDHFATRRATLYNERDLHHLITMARSERHYQLFLSFTHSFKKGLISSDFVINYFALQTHIISPEVFMMVVRTHYRALTIETLNIIISTILESVEGRQLLKTISRRQHEKFVLLVKRITHSKQDTRMLLSLLELTSKKGRILTRKTLKSLSAQRHHLEKLLGYKLTEYNLTEVWRYGVSKNLLDDSNTGRLFQKILSRSWNVDKLMKRCRPPAGTVSRGKFREQFRTATSSEKRRLKIRLQAMGQALSVVDASQIADTLNCLRVYLHEDKEFVMCSDRFGRYYILDHFIRCTMRFIFRSGEGENGIFKMRAVLKGLNFDSIVMQASIFEYMTLHKPRMSLDILENYKHKPFLLTGPIINGIEQGILTSKKLEKHARLSLFQAFQEKKARLGFSTQLCPATMILMGNLVFDIADDISHSIELNEFIRSAYQKGVPARVIRKWRDKR